MVGGSPTRFLTSHQQYRLVSNRRLLFAEAQIVALVFVIFQHL
jgi:hypothetical protein